jgi:hypothetical protein
MQLLCSYYLWQRRLFGLRLYCSHAQGWPKWPPVCLAQMSSGMVSRFLKETLSRDLGERALEAKGIECSTCTDKVTMQK